MNCETLKSVENLEKYYDIVMVVGRKRGDEGSTDTYLKRGTKKEKMELWNIMKRHIAEV